MSLIRSLVEVSEMMGLIEGIETDEVVRTMIERERGIDILREETLIEMISRTLTMIDQDREGTMVRRSPRCLLLR